MPAKKSTDKGPLQRTAPRDIKPPYSCDDPPKPPLGLEEVLRLIKKRGDFAYFFRTLLCTANRGGPGSQEAQECLQKWYKPVEWELLELCFSPTRAARLPCTDQNLLIEVAAYYFGGPGKLRFSFGPRPERRKSKKKGTRWHKIGEPPETQIRCGALTRSESAQLLKNTSWFESRHESWRPILSRIYPAACRKPGVTVHRRPQQTCGTCGPGSAFRAAVALSRAEATTLRRYLVILQIAAEGRSHGRLEASPLRDTAHRK